MKYLLILSLAILAACSPQTNPVQQEFKTVCNPMNLSYRFRPEEPSRREAADPTVIEFKGAYYLFASKSGGYWHSLDLATWNFIENNEIPTEDYAPTAIVLRDTIFMAVSSKKNNKIYKTADPLSGHWISNDTLDFAVEDPFFYQDNNQLYLYWGCSNVRPLYASEIDMNSFSLRGETQEVIHQNPAEYGWEVRGDYNTEYDNAPWLEGCWVNKHQGKYYLQYSAPGTREKSYSDGVYVANDPLGPFTLAAHNPFAYKPEGFACGAGHGSTIADAYGNYWHLGTISISVKHIFERRIGFYPAFWDKDGIMHSTTKYGDYPIIIPNNKVDNFDDLFPGWMLLSYQKPVQVSSELSEYTAPNVNDEEIRTYWSAATNNPDEWMMMDLTENYDIYALQVNFAEHNTKIYGRQPNLKYQYIIEASNDSKTWHTIVDKSNNQTDNSHDYIQLPQKVNYRYIRIKNIHVPSGNIAICGFRVFGKGQGQLPTQVTNFTTVRNKTDRRSVTLSWDKSAGATGYNISFGSHPDKLYHNYLVYADTTVTIRSLNANQEYYFEIEAFNENGITK
ncbi:family 43 glycosylhydrolase [Labilibacter marinus]|uniref:family 43 glycosylhydrolase n=1 Tax=Labilibacter marinus TaxID=1477105 RepID=UPI00082AEB93|nr:family 43 glycosylhydrolase [Labilibacter marinus]